VTLLYIIFWQGCKNLQMDSFFSKNSKADQQDWRGVPIPLQPKVMCVYGTINWLNQRLLDQNKNMFYENIWRKFEPSSLFYIWIKSSAFFGASVLSTEKSWTESNIDQMHVANCIAIICMYWITLKYSFFLSYILSKWTPLFDRNMQMFFHCFPSQSYFLYLISITVFFKSSIIIFFI